MGKTHMAFGGLFTAVGLPLANQKLGLDLSTSEMLVGVALGTAAGVLPDVDHPNSLITQGVIPGTGAFGVIGKALGWFFSIPPRLLGLAVRQVMGHRGGTHSFLFAVGWAVLVVPVYALFFSVAAFLIGAVIGPFAAMFGVADSFGGALSTASHVAVDGILAHIPMISVAVFLGYIAHLYSDSLTRVPVPWPWPLKIGPNQGRWFLAPKGMRILTGGDFERVVVKPIVMLATLGALLFFTVLPAGQNIWQERQDDGKPLIDKSKSDVNPFDNPAVTTKKSGGKG